MSKIIKPASPALILPDRWMHQPSQQQQGRFGFGLVGGGAQVISTPWNPADKSSKITLSNGNFTASGTQSASNASVRGVQSRAAGKSFFELAITGGNVLGVGLANANESLDNYVGQSADSIGYARNGGIFSAAASVGTGPSYAVGDYIGVAVDFSAAKVWFLKNGTSVSGNPATGSGGFSIPAGALFAAVNIFDNNVSKCTINTGGTPFAFSAPSGFLPWS